MIIEYLTTLNLNQFHILFDMLAPVLKEALEKHLIHQTLSINISHIHAGILSKVLNVYFTNIQKYKSIQQEHK
jgi:hypothetical protein